MSPRLETVVATAIAAAVLTAGCGDSAAPAPPDGGAVGFEVQAPAITPCPEGWTELASPIACRPWADEGPETCVEGEAHFPGGEGCEPIGDPCPEDGWPADLPADREVLFVRSGASGGDGSRERPLGSARDAMRIAGEGTIIALARGVHRGWISMQHAGVELRGACAAQTRLEGESADYPAVLFSVDGGVVRNLSISGAAEGIAIARGVATAHLDGVEIVAARHYGIATIAGSTLQAHEVVVRGCLAGDGYKGTGIGLEGELVLDRGVIRGNDGDGIDAYVSTAAVTLRDVAIADNGRASDTHVALSIEHGRASLERAVIHGDLGIAAIDVSGADAVVEVRDSLIEGGPIAVAEWGRGVQVVDAQVSVSRSQIVGAATYGIYGDGTPRLTVADVIVRGTRPSAETGERGHGIFVRGGESRLERVLIAESHEAGLSWTGAGGRAELVDVHVDVVNSTPELGLRGRGIHVEPGVTITAERVAIDGAHEAGLVVWSATLTATDLAIRGTRPMACDESTCAGEGLGSGLVVIDAAAVSVERFSFVDSTLCGVQIVGDAMLDLRDGVIARNAIGVAVQAPAFDVARIGDRVRYESNERNLSRDHVPAPEAIGFPGTLP